MDWCKYDTAWPNYTRAHDIYITVFGTEHPRVADVLHSMAGLCQEQGDYKKATQLYDKSLKLKEKAVGSCSSRSCIDPK